VTVIASTLIEGGGGCRPTSHVSAGAQATREKKERKMRDVLKAATASAAALAVAVALGTLFVPKASAGEFCRTDVTGHMTGCGYDNMEQCQAASSGIGGDCFRDPHLPQGQSASNGRNAGNSSNAFAYQPKSSHTRRGSPRAGNAANTNQ
jgi:uncharacterized protein DUF3551